MLSINLSAAALQIDNVIGVSGSDVFGAGAAPTSTQSADLCPGGDCATSAVAGPGCTPSPENGTALLAVLGFAGLLAGRVSYGRLRSRRALSAA